MTNQYVALLRAINVGGRVVKMADLKKIFEGLRFSEVATFIASGNVVFKSSAQDAAKLESQIERALQEALGFAVTTFLRTTREMASVAEFEPFSKKAMDGASIYVGFMSTHPGADVVRKVATFRTATDDFKVQGRELYWLCRTNMLDSKVSPALLEKTVGQPSTMRNVNTVRRLAAKYPPQG